MSQCCLVVLLFPIMLQGRHESFIAYFPFRICVNGNKYTESLIILQHSLIQAREITTSRNRLVAVKEEDTTRFSKLVLASNALIQPSWEAIYEDRLQGLWHDSTLQDIEKHYPVGHSP